MTCDRNVSPGQPPNSSRFYSSVESQKSKKRRVDHLLSQGEFGFYMMDSNGNFVGEEDYSLVEKLSWPEKLLCQIRKRYKARFKRIKPMTFKNEE